MISRRASIALPIAAACLAFALAVPASAQPRAASPAPDAQSAARTRAEEGLSLFKDGRWEEAFTAFADADRLFHAPTLVSYMGTCRRNQGRLVEAKALYDKVLAEPVPPNAPDAFKKAVETARAEVEKLRGRIPLLKIKLAGPGADQAKVVIDGAAHGAAEVAAGKPIDPGEHTIEAEAEANGASARTKVTLKEGDAPQIELTLIASGAAATPPDGKPVDAPKGSWLPAGLAFGLGGAGVAAGAVIGLIAAGKVADAHQGCTPPDAAGVRHCPPGNEAAASSASKLITGSGVAFGVGGAGLVAGVVLAIVRPGGAAAKAARRGLDVDVGAGFVTVRGRF